MLFRGKKGGMLLEITQDICNKRTDNARIVGLIPVWAIH